MGMTALQKRAIKGQLIDHFTDLGFRVTCTDTPEIVIFSDKPLRKKSKKIRGMTLLHPYITSFGPVEAQKILDVKKIIR